MKYTLTSLLLLALIFLSFSGRANMVYTVSFKKGNIHIELEGGYSFEAGRKVQIFLELADKLVSKKFANATPLFLFFSHDYTKSDTAYCTLGYGHFSFLNTGRDTTTGLNICIRDRDFDIKKALLLVNAAFENIDFIKANQSTYIIKSRYRSADTLNSVAVNLVQQYLSSADNAVESVMNEKIYRGITKTREHWDIDYYYQNNQFHFYNTRKPEEKWSDDKGKYVVVNTFGEDILTVNNVVEIFGNVYDGHFVFTDDSTFYYIPQIKEPVRGPFIIHNIEPGRRTVEKYYHDNHPIEKFTLFIDKKDGDDKVLFIPDSNLVVSDYGKLEHELIKGFFKKQPQVKAKPALSGMVITLLILLACCLIVILVLVMRLRK